MASAMYSGSELLCCCSKKYTGFFESGAIRFNARSRMSICACWQPKLKIVAPATLGLLMYPASKLQRVTASEVEPPQPPSCVKKCMPSTLGNSGFFCLFCLLAVRSARINSCSEAPDLYLSISTDISKLCLLGFS